ncbi:unnamed protein product, partial [Ectocarpus fasciculatus]
RSTLASSSRPSARWRSATRCAGVWRTSASRKKSSSACWKHEHTQSATMASSPPDACTSLRE